MKHIFLGCLAAFLSVTARSASAPQRLPATLQGNWSTTDGGRQWTYGFYPHLAIWQNVFWDYAGIADKGSVTTIQLRERGGDRTATLYAHWDVRDSVARIGLSPKSLTPYSRKPIANPSYRIPAAQDPDYPAGDSIFREGTALLRGYLDGYSPEAMAGTIKLYGFNTVTVQDVPAVADISADGTFEMSVPLGHPITTQIVLTGTFYENVYIEPGDTLTLYCNLENRKGTSSSRYMGRSGRVNREMNDLRRLYLPFSQEDQTFLMVTTPDSVRAWIDGRVARDSAATAKYIASNGISRKGAFLARWAPYVTGGEKLGFFALYREIKKIETDTAFFNFYRQMPMDDPRMLGIYDHRFLLNRLEFCPVYREQNPAPLRYSDLVSAGFPIASEDLPLIDSLTQGLLAVPGDSAATAAILQRTNEKLFELYGMFFPVHNAVQDNRQIYSKGDAYWGRPMPFLNDLIAARWLHSSLQRADRNIPNCWLAMILGQFTSPYMIATVLDANDALRPAPVAVAAGPYVPSDRGERLLDSLLRQHRGRVVYVDFWSTGCGPCRQGMIQSRALKEKLAGKPVDFVYITSTDQSPEDIAAEFIEQNKITGRQIRLTPDEWNILAAKYKINGIPHYMIVGADGRVVDPHYMGHGADEVSAALLKAVGE